VTGANPSAPAKSQTRDADQSGQVLDEALEDSFPASDPIASSPKRGGKDDKRVDVAAPPCAPVPDAAPETTDAKTPSNMATFHKVFERRRR